MDNRAALDPRRSVVVEACAGSGKTWLLVSRIVRLLLDGAAPSQILAITFTRKAAQEMQVRLQEWLRQLALEDDAFVRRFFAERGLDALGDDDVRRARGLYEAVLLAQPGITVSTFHGWFMQVIRRAPLNADVMQGMTLLERTGSEQEEAWEELLEHLRRQPDSTEAQRMQWLFGEYGLAGTRRLLAGFLSKRSEWWAFTQGRDDPPAFALERLRADLGVDMAADPCADWGTGRDGEEAVMAFAQRLARNGTAVQQTRANEIEQAWTDAPPAARYARLSALLFTRAGEPRSFKPTKMQVPDADAFLAARDALFSRLQSVRDALAEQHAYRLNEAALHCGAALLHRYQALKAQKQQMDFADLEWQLCRLLQDSEHAETMQYKLDSRYRHVLLDEFQDTNPLQWHILRAWFDAAVAVDSQPSVFVVGDPKQSIYRFRRADARLFGVARDYLGAHFAAHDLRNNHTRRNAPSVLDAVNAVFRDHPDGFDDFEPHTAEQTGLPGHVMALDLAVAPAEEAADETSAALTLRDPLSVRRTERENGARHVEAEQFAGLLQSIVRDWSVRDGGGERRAAWGDIMVLVRSRTHLATYEAALRARHIPFISSRRGGLLDTLEAEDIQALLTFLITPFADLELAQVLRSPIFSCSDEDLLRLAGASSATGEGEARHPPSPSSPLPQGEREAWWRRLQRFADPSPALQRAAELLQRWLALADKLPVHDLLDRIYFEGDVLARYAAVLPAEMRAKTLANLNALMEIALSVDAGRYPSLPRFLQELGELRDSRDDAPDEGRLGSVGNAVRIYTVHEAKGLEAPIVWLLDAHADRNARDSHDILLDWPPDSPAPVHFSLYTDQASRGKKRAPLFEHEAAQQAREEMNLLYVAMTRARQALIVSGSKGARDSRAPTWYERIAAVAEKQDNPLLRPAPAATVPAAAVSLPEATLPRAQPVGARAARSTAQQQRGVWLHGLLQYLADESAPDQAELQQRLAIPPDEIGPLWQQAQHLLALPQLRRYFDPRLYRSAQNEMAYVGKGGELKRIDRLVEFDDEVWVLDYKSGENASRAQVREYRDAMQSVYTGKNVRCALLFADGRLEEIG